MSNKLLTKKDIIMRLNDMSIENFELVSNYQYGHVVNVHAEVNLYDRKLTHIPVKFGEVLGDFWCSRNRLTDLSFAPHSTKGSFYANDNQLTSLKNCPVEVGGRFLVHGNHLIDFQYCPKIVGSDFCCSDNPLLGEVQDITDFNKILKIQEQTLIRLEKEKLNQIDKNMSNQFLNKKNDIIMWLNDMRIENFELVPDSQYGYVVNVHAEVNLHDRNLSHVPVKFGEVLGDFWCSRNCLKDLSFAPHSAKGSFYANENQLISLKNCPMEVGGRFFVRRNHLIDFQYCPKIVGSDFCCSDNSLLGEVQDITDFNEILKIQEQTLIRLEKEKLNRIVGLASHRKKIHKI